MSLKAALSGAFGAGIIGVLWIGGGWVVQEYQDYQRLKKEASEVRRFLEEPVVTFPDGKTLSRQQFLDGLIYNSFQKKPEK